MIASMILAALAAPTAAPVRLADDIVRIGDVAAVATGRELAILRLPAGRQEVTLQPDTLRTLIAHRLPGVIFSLRQEAAVRLARGGASARPAANCLSARVDIAAGAPIDGAMVARGRCTGAATRLGYDRALRAPIARQDIATGANLGPLRIADARVLAAGQTLMLRTRTGPVTIERQVTSLQPARPGARLFVRTQDGAVLSSRLTDATR